MSRVLGIDLGTRTVGLALSDEGRAIAQPLRTLRRVGPRKDVAAVQLVIEEQEVGEVVIGDPRNLDGTPGAMTEEVHRFAGRLREASGLAVELWDERFSTVAAERALREGGLDGRRRRRVVDHVAAALILQGWLDRQAAGDRQG